jgi:hypothetical protein
MAILENIGGWLGTMSKALLVTMIASILGGVVIAFAWIIMRAKQFKQYMVLIWKRKRDKEDNEFPIFVGIDKGAIIKDRKLKKRVLRLKRNNVHLGEEENLEQDENRELDIPSIPSEKGGEIVFVEKLGPRKFALGRPFVIDGTVKIIVSEADCAEAIRGYDTNAKYYGGKEWTKWVGPITFAVFAILIIIMISVVLNKFEILDKVADKLVRTAEIMQAGRSSAVVSGAP